MHNRFLLLYKVIWVELHLFRRPADTGWGFSLKLLAKVVHSLEVRIRITGCAWPPDRLAARLPGRPATGLPRLQVGPSPACPGPAWPGSAWPVLACPGHAPPQHKIHNP